MTIDIDSIPPLPSRNQSGFSDQVDAFITWFLNTFPAEFNAAIVALNLNSTNGTSASSVAIGTGAKSFTASTGKSWQPGMWLVIADTAAPSTNYMIGTVTSYNTSTGALVMNILLTGGSGTKTAWTISQSAPGGAALTTNAYTGSQWFAKGADIVSAATTNVWSTDGNLVHVTGSTGPITSLGTAPQAGAWKLVIFDSTPTLTHSANLNLQDNENFTAEAGDIALVIADTTTQFDVIFWRKIKQASQTRKGEVELATAAEFNAGTDPNRVPAVQTIRENGWVYMASQAASGTILNFTGIPSWATEIEIFPAAFSTSSTVDLLVLIGDAGGNEVTGYVSASCHSASGGNTLVSSTAGFIIYNSLAAFILDGVIKLHRINAATFEWMQTHNIARTDSNASITGAGRKALSAALDRFSITTVTGVPTLDAGNIYARYR
jgi:hypothetical protein